MRQRFDDLGDSVLVYFGYPQARQDDTQRALRAGLELVVAGGKITIGFGTLGCEHEPDR